MIYQSFNEKKRFYPGSHCINELNDFENLYRKLERNINTGTLFPQSKIISLEAFQDAMSSIL